MQAWFLGWEDLLEEGMATHSSILAWKIPWTEEPGRLQSVRSQSQTRLKRLSSSMILNIPWRMVYRVAWIYLLSFRMYLLFSYLIIIKSVKQNVWNSCTPLLDPWHLQWISSALHFQQMPYLFHRVNKIHTVSSLFCHNILTSLNMYQTFSPFLSG